MKSPTQSFSEVIQAGRNCEGR